MREKLIELPIDDAILILKEELKQRVDGYTTYLSNGGKGDPAEEVGLDALSMAISALEQTKWISVNERLPDKHDRYLCNVKAFSFPDLRYFAILKYDDGGFIEGKIYTDDVTHWMPLPEPPKGE